MSLQALRQTLSAACGGRPATGMRRVLPPATGSALAGLKRLARIALHARRTVHRLEGPGRWSDAHFTADLACEEGELAFFSRLLYAAAPARTPMGFRPAGAAGARAPDGSPAPDLVIASADRCFSGRLRRRGFVVLPAWVDLAMDLPRPLSELWRENPNRSRDDDLRKIRQRGFARSPSRDPAEVERFHREFYLPHVAARFGPSACPHGIRRLRENCVNGVVLRILRGGEHVAGCVVDLRDGVARLAYVGVRDGDAGLLRQGAESAAYYFALTFAEENGARSFDFGLCRPLLSDGVLQYKKKWGAGLMESRRVASVFGVRVPAVFGVRVPGPTEGALGFLVRHPMVFMHGGRLRVLVFAGQDRPVTGDEIDRLDGTCAMPGLEDLLVVSARGFSGEALERARAAAGGRFRLLPLTPRDFWRGLPRALDDTFRAPESSGAGAQGDGGTRP